MNRFRFLCALLLIGASAFLSACAKPSAVFVKDGVAIRGYDAVAYFTQGQPVKGLPQFQAQYQGAAFHFASQANRDAFAAAPEKFAPQYGGYCAYGMASNYKATTDPAAFTITGGKLYLNYNREIHKTWSADVPGFVKKADANWPEASKKSKVHD